VVVAAAGGRQAEIVSQGDEPGPFGIRLVGMEHLKAGQSYGGQPGDLLVRDPGVPARPRVGQHGHAARRPDQADGADGVERVPPDVSAAAVGDPVAGERLAGGGDGAAVRHRPGDVRPADHGLPGDGRDLLPADVHAEAGEPVDHSPGAQHAVVADAGEFGGQVRLIRVEHVGQHVQAASVQAAGQFHAGEQRHRADRGPCLGVSGHRIVVGERHYVEADQGGAAHHLGGRIGPVRGTAVHMQVSAH
jgi:hypothetical protein